MQTVHQTEHREHQTTAAREIYIMHETPQLLYTVGSMSTYSNQTGISRRLHDAPIGVAITVNAIQLEDSGRAETHHYSSGKGGETGNDATQCGGPDPLLARHGAVGRVGPCAR